MPGMINNTSMNNAMKSAESNAVEKARQVREALIMQANSEGYVPRNIQDINGMGGIAGGLSGQQSLADLYGNAATDWYGSGLTPKGMLSDEYRYDPELIDINMLEQANPYDFDPMRQEAMSGLMQQQQSGYQTALTQQAASGGLSASDRMAMASQFNRGLLGAQAGLSAKIGTAEAENLWQTDKANADLMNKAMLQNLELQNQAKAANLSTLMGERRMQGDIARDMYQEDERIRQAKKIGAEL